MFEKEVNLEIIDINQLQNCCGINFKVEVEEIADIIICFFYEVFLNANYKEQLIEKFNVSDFQFEVKKCGYMYEIIIIFNYYDSEKKALFNFSKVLVNEVKSNVDSYKKIVINKMILIKVIETKISVINLWEFECKQLLLEVLNYSLITKENMEIFKEKSNFLNHFLYCNTVDNISNNIELYKNEEIYYMKIQYIKKVLEILEQVECYMNNLLENIFEESEVKVSSFKHLELKRSKQMLKKMLTVDFE